jgi:hypothetical protein
MPPLLSGSVRSLVGPGSPNRNGQFQLVLNTDVAMFPLVAERTTFATPKSGFGGHEEESQSPEALSRGTVSFAPVTPASGKCRLRRQLRQVGVRNSSFTYEDCPLCAVCAPRLAVSDVWSDGPVEIK